MFLNALAFVPYTVVQGLGRPDIKAKLDMVELPLFALLTFLGVQQFGLVGAALAKLAITVFDVGALSFFAARLLRPDTAQSTPVTVIGGVA